MPGEHGDVRRIRTRAGARRTKGWGRARGARRLRAGLCAPAGARRTKGWGRARIARQSRTESVHTPGPSKQRAEDAPGSTSAGGAHQTTKKQEGHRTSEYQLAGRCARQARSRQNYATQGRIKPQGRRYVDSSPEKAGASTDLHAGSSTANLQ